MPSASRVSKRGKRPGGWLIILLFLAGLGVLTYPLFSDIYYQHKYEEEIAAWEASRPQKDYSALWQEAEQYNAELAEKGEQLYLFAGEQERVWSLLNPMGNGMMGYVEIPKIHVRLPIYQGTEEAELQSGCGWWIGTSLPTGGESTHCVITAHNGLVKAKLFTDLDQLEIGDVFSLSILDRVMAYEVDQILVTEPEEMEPLMIVPGEDLVTLYTCVPYGVNTHRLLVRGHRVETPVEAAEGLNLKWICIFLFMLLILGLLFWLYRRYFRRKSELDGKTSQRKKVISHQTD